ncbi:hypothetical protein SSX86_014172 [Deinandra increscens subsp. villosa]|uniref:GAG-pre-integrase domain-containing protein n=1 Tax=Deinandra increscens subsp. villosa TaxID=3103831 RepID=A0AAP0D8Z0_9ASTR
MTTVHPALTVTNIKNFIPVPLETKSSKFLTWKQLFKIHCKAFDCYEHLEHETPPTPQATEKDKAPPPIDLNLWTRVDALVLQWIYSTISLDLVQQIMKEDTTACKAWKMLQQMFNDNEASRALTLENQFISTKLDSFADVSSYCQELKELADQLANVNNPVSNQRMVLQLVAGLNESYDGVAMLIQQSNPLPDFSVARSKLLLEESRKARQVASSAALHATVPSQDSTPPPAAAFAPAQQPHGSGYGRGRSDSGQRTSRGRRNQGRNNYQGRGRGFVTGPQRGFAPSPWQPQHPPSWQWASPAPCPYPTAPIYRPVMARPGAAPSNSPGILGPGPQAYVATDSYYVPTNIDQAYVGANNNFTPDPTWYLDTGATNHMSHSAGKLSSYVLNSRLNSIVVGNGSQIPIHGTGHTTINTSFPLHLKDILVSPSLIKNLCSVRRLTTDNNISIEFDRFGFLVKDYRTQRPILRSNSSGPLYPFPSQLQLATPPSTFAAVSHDLWHSRLGHPGSSIIRILNSRNNICVNNISDSSFCQSCVMGKQIKLPFYDSISHTSSPFDIVHSDLWTSPILSSGGHKYYVLFLDNFTNYLWTYPLAKKSSVFTVFLNFHNIIKTQFS